MHGKAPGTLYLSNSLRSINRARSNMHQRHSKSQYGLLRTSRGLNLLRDSAESTNGKSQWQGTFPWQQHVGEVWRGMRNRGTRPAADGDPNELTYLEEDGDRSSSFGAG